MNISTTFYNISDIVNTDKSWSWTKVLFCTLFCLLIITVIVGNTLVILSVITTRRLRTVTNCFVTSLAVADWLVGIFVMPPAVIEFLVGNLLNIHLMWVAYFLIIYSNGKILDFFNFN